MNRKLALVFLIIAIIVFVTFIKETFVSQEEIQYSKKSEIAKVNNLETNKKTTNNKTLKVLSEKKQPTVYLFDADPVVDKYLILSKYQDCMVYFKPVKSIFGAIDVTPKKYSKEQQKRLDEFYKYCEQEKKKYPDYFENDVFSFALNLEKTKAQSPLGQFITLDLDKRAKQNYEKHYQTLKNSHPNLLFNALNLLGAGFTKEVLHPNLQDILRSHDIRYIQSIAKYVQNSYACSQGADCGLNSNLMITYCKINENLCVDTFEELLKTRLSIAQQKDIELASQFYVSLFDENK